MLPRAMASSSSMGNCHAGPQVDGHLKAPRLDASPGSSCRCQAESTVVPIGYRYYS